MQHEIVVYITGICSQATNESVINFCILFTGEIYKVTVFPSYNGKTTSANVSVYSYSSAYNLINAINYCEVDGYTLYANICGYDSIRIQKEDLYSIFISQGHFSSERELFESCLVFGQVFRVKLLLGCAIVQFYNEESMNKALSARHIRGGKISKKTPRKVSNSKKIDKNDTPIKSDPVLLSEKQINQNWKSMKKELK
ncbi:hypothetical protein TVAG_476120 [Trichomonas vaginalis G3]|uniref:RRM domain-containing protein n=1 Tax=Trichomonas vaginalis (strain ATCC PRA-98 / G3) TaxID=412133 RepID=A2DA35_TRIV3|nr:RNA-binding domain, RBD family-containing protein [Trichomonas vaginalis G3]EAY22683.1 hypothetical protein TVAG_476120 [Trichomonas vaginalis G3]KAI5525497.1 RNA-binding domain, RBD family-containing protein [Trichomonas vaginalis G3]|eukprot:XP_001583669.1 hypothetical protein [Trichomonas vaginalis G3]